MEPKRSLPDVFLNVTLYNTKGNQQEEQFPFLRHCTAIAKHLRKLRNQDNKAVENLRSGILAIWNCYLRDESQLYTITDIALHMYTMSVNEPHA
jgi:hypothetical protein